MSQPDWMRARIAEHNRRVRARAAKPKPTRRPKSPRTKTSSTTPAQRQESGTMTLKPPLVPRPTNPAHEGIPSSPRAGIVGSTALRCLGAILLNYCRGLPPLTMRELAQQIGVGLTRVYQLLERLEADGLIASESNSKRTVRPAVRVEVVAKEIEP